MAGVEGVGQRQSVNRTRMLLLAAAGVLAGCNMFAPDSGQITLEAEYAARGTEVAAVRATATVQSERLAVTVEAGSTALGRAYAQTTRIAATLFALGTPFVDIRLITPPAPEELQSIEAGQGATGPTSLQVAPIVQPTIIGQGGAQGNATLGSTPDVQPVAIQSPDPALPALLDPVTAAAVGGDDCALAPVTAFDSAAAGVYVVATARSIGPANRLVARWLREGVEQVSYEWSPGFTIGQGCIWFYMPAAEVDFSPGNWTVQIDLDGVAGAPLAFSVAGMDAAAGG